MSVGETPPELFHHRDYSIEPVDSIGLLGRNNQPVSLQAAGIEMASIDQEDDEGETTTVHYENLIMVNGSKLGPVKYLTDDGSDAELVSIESFLEPLPDSFDGPLLRTRLPQCDTSALGALARLNGLVVASDDMDSARQREMTRLYRRWVGRHFRVPHHTREPRLWEGVLWVRFEPSVFAEPHILGKVIVARLAVLEDEPSRGGIVPLIYESKTQSPDIVEPPTQLKLADPWLYAILDEDPLHDMFR